jgi:hypothetical protein
MRRSTLEHPFGSIKGWMGATHFLTKGRRSGSCLHMNRVRAIIGVVELNVALAA